MSMTASETQNETFLIQPSQMQLNFEGSIHQVQQQQQQQTPRGLISSDISGNGDCLDEKTESKPKKTLVEDNATFLETNDGTVKSIDLRDSARHVSYIDTAAGSSHHLGSADSAWVAPGLSGKGFDRSSSKEDDACIVERWHGKVDQSRLGTSRRRKVPRSGSSAVSDDAAEYKSLKESDADILEQWKEKEKEKAVRVHSPKVRRSGNDDALERRPRNPSIADENDGMSPGRCRDSQPGFSALSHIPASKNNRRCLSGDDGDGECDRCDRGEIGSRFKEPLHENAPVNLSSLGSSPFLSNKPPKAVNTITFSHYHSTDNLITPPPSFSDADQEVCEHSTSRYELSSDISTKNRNSVVDSRTVCSDDTSARTGSFTSDQSTSVVAASRRDVSISEPLVKTSHPTEEALSLNLLLLQRQLNESTLFAEALGERPPNSVHEITQSIIDDEEEDDDDDDDDEDDDCNDGGVEVGNECDDIAAEVQFKKQASQMGFPESLECDAPSEKLMRCGEIEVLNMVKESNAIIDKSQPPTQPLTDKKCEGGGSKEVMRSISPIHTHLANIQYFNCAHELQVTNPGLNAQIKNIECTPNIISTGAIDEMQAKESQGGEIFSTTVDQLAVDVVRAPEVCPSRYDVGKNKEELGAAQSSETALIIPYASVLSKYIDHNSKSGEIQKKTEPRRISKRCTSDPLLGSYHLLSLTKETEGIPFKSPLHRNNVDSFSYRGLRANPPEIVKRGYSRGNYAQLHRKAWLEVSDKHHRYGKHLRFYYKHWENLGHPTNMFFGWLDSKGEAAGEPLPNLPECPRSQLDSDTVRYITNDDVTTEYEVLIKAKKLPFYMDSNNSMDETENLTQEAQITKERRSLSAPAMLAVFDCGTKYSSASSSFNDENFKYGDMDTTFFDIRGNPIATGPEGWIFVLRDGKIYAAPKVTSCIGKSRQRFHHSSFFGGKAVAGAGIIITDDNGHLLRLYPHSGHYRPGEAHLQRTLFHLQQSGVDLRRFQIDLQDVFHVSRKFLPCLKVVPNAPGENVAVEIVRNYKAMKAKKTESLYLKPASYVASYLAHKALLIGNGVYDQIHQIRSCRVATVHEAIDIIDGEKKQQ